MNPKFRAISHKVSNSLRLAVAIFRKCLNSFGPDLDDPSLILAGTETAALLIWDIKPYLKVFVGTHTVFYA